MVGTFGLCIAIMASVAFGVVIGVGFVVVIAMSIHNSRTVLHSIGVAVVARRFSVVLGLDRVMTLGVVLNALFHDVGKLSISSAILDKKGRLTDSEYAVVRSHTSNVWARFFGFFFPACRDHHMDADNMGYGSGGRQEFMGAVIEICDVYDALTGRGRTYAAQRTTAQISTIMTEMEHKFDQELFVVFMANIDAFESRTLNAIDTQLYRSGKAA